LQATILEAVYRHQFGVIAGRERLVGIKKFPPAERTLMHADADPAKECYYTLTRDAVEKRPIGDGCVGLTVLDIPYIGGRKLRDMAERIEHHCIIEAPRPCLA
jgi:hypothetical protein